MLRSSAAHRRRAHRSEDAHQLNIWILNHYAGGPRQQATRSFDIGRELVARGHSVTICSSAFNHYLRRFDAPPGGRAWRTEVIDGVRFVWINTFPYQENDWRRAANVVSYSALALVFGLTAHERPDVTIGTCVHPLAPATAYVVSRIKRARFIYEVTDLWPQSLVDAGVISADAPIARVLYWLEGHLFRRSERIISLLPFVGDYVIARGITKGVVWVPNGVDLRHFRVPPPVAPHDGPFRILYVGGHTRYHGLDVLLHAAKILESSGSEIEITIVGDGVDKPRLVRMAEELRLRTVRFQGMVPKTEVSSTMQQADALFYCARPVATLQYGTSSAKIFEYLASRRPIVHAMRARNDPVQEAGAGITVAPDDPDAVAQAILKIGHTSIEDRRAMGERGLRYVEANHSISALTDRFEAALEEPAPHGKPRA